MELKIPFSRLFILIVFIFVLNYLAMKFYWYSSIWYLDMIMHFLGGIWLASVIIYFLNIKEIYFKQILKIILGVLLIGIFWEVFEILVNEFVINNTFNILDTISDLFFDIVGGFFVILFFLKKIIHTEKNNV